MSGELDEIFEYKIRVESNPTEHVITIYVLFIPTNRLIENIKSLFQTFYKEVRTASWIAYNKGTYGRR